MVLEYKNKSTVVDKDVSGDLPCVTPLDRCNFSSAAREATCEVKTEKELLLKRFSLFNILRTAFLSPAIPLHQPILSIVPRPAV
jgi:hypothetical protein